MSFFRKCQCKRTNEFVDITKDYPNFTKKLTPLDFEDWVKLMECGTCGQLWKVDEWDKYQTSYALKIEVRDGWKDLDMLPYIKAKMVENRGGLEKHNCIMQQCSQRAVKGSVYCVDHLYETGTRA